MKTIGILGGMSPESTVAYYEYLTRTYTERYGDYGYPPIVIYSVSFQPYVDWPAAGRWDLVAEGLGAAAQKLEAAGADFILIATNTMHRVLDEVQARVTVPLLSLLEVVGDLIEGRGWQRVGLLGTRFTMESDLYTRPLGERGIEVLVPDPEARSEVDRVIYEELVAGEINPASRARFKEIVVSLEQAGAEGVILGCTEIPLLLRPQESALPLVDTTRVHAEAALEYALVS
jgi:aspartate racemase